MSKAKRARAVSNQSGKSTKSRGKRKVEKIAAPIVEAKGKRTAKAHGAGPLTKEEASSKLLEKIRQRKSQGQESAGAKNTFGQPVRRRGRRPKGMEDYQPYREDQEDGLAADDPVEQIQYDTGIQIAAGGEDASFRLERDEDFDEELNFDW